MCSNVNRKWLKHVRWNNIAVPAKWHANSISISEYFFVLHFKKMQQNISDYGNVKAEE